MYLLKVEKLNKNTFLFDIYFFFVKKNCNQQDKNMNYKVTSRTKHSGITK